MARPTIFTEEIAAKIISSIAVGNFRETAAAAAGIGSRTLRDWMKRGAAGEIPFEAFAARMDHAEAECESRDVLSITVAGKKDWKATAWRLERKNPKKWGFRVRVEVREELEAFMTKLRERLPMDLYMKVLEIAADDRDATIGDGVEGNEPDAGESAVFTDRDPH